MSCGKIDSVDWQRVGIVLGRLGQRASTCQRRNARNITLNIHVPSFSIHVPSSPRNIVKLQAYWILSNRGGWFHQETLDSLDAICWNLECSYRLMGHHTVGWNVPLQIYVWMISGRLTSINCLNIRWAWVYWLFFQLMIGMLGRQMNTLNQRSRLIHPKRRLE